MVRAKRNNKGTSILELPAGMWITLIVFLLPMMSLASITLRCTLMNVAVLESVHAASKARTFELASDEGASATELANTAFDKYVNAFPGLEAGKLKLRIVSTDIKSGAISSTDSKLKNPADSSGFVYQVEGDCTGRIQPVFAMSREIIGDIPGLSTAMNVSFSAREMCENPQGLNR